METLKASAERPGAEPPARRGGAQAHAPLTPTSRGARRLAFLPPNNCPAPERGSSAKSQRQPQRQGFPPDHKLFACHGAPRVQSRPLQWHTHRVPSRSDSEASQRGARTQSPPGTPPQCGARAPLGPQAPLTPAPRGAASARYPPWQGTAGKCHRTARFLRPEHRLGGAGEARGGPAEGARQPEARTPPGPGSAGPGVPRSPPLARKGGNPPARGFNRSAAPPACRRGNSRGPPGRGAGGGAARRRGADPGPRARSPPAALAAAGAAAGAEGGKFNLPRLRRSPRRGGRAPAAGPPHPHRSAQPTPPARAPPPWARAAAR